MATVFNPNKKDPNEKKPTGLASQGPVTSGGMPSAANKAGAAPGGQAPIAGKPSSSGRFTNIQSYLNANQGSGLAGQVSGKIGNVAQGATEQLQKAGDAFKQASDQGKAASFDENVYSQIGQAKGVDAVGEAFKQAGEQLNTQYKGPMELGNQQNILANQQQLQGLTGQTGSAEGRAALLKNFFAKPTYAQGQNRLDTLILGGKQERPELQKTKAVSGQFGRDVSQTTKQATQEAQSKTTQAEDTRTKSKSALEGAKTQQQKDLENQIAQFSTSEEERASKRFSADANKNQVSQGTAQMASALGLSPEQVLQATATYNKGQANLQNINPEQAAVLNQIAKLTGGQELALQDKVQQGQYGIDESGLSGELAPIYSRLNDRGAGGYGQLSGSLGDTSQLLGAGYNADQLRGIADRATRIALPWGVIQEGIEGGPEKAIENVIAQENANRNSARQQALNNALANLYKKSGYQG